MRKNTIIKPGKTIITVLLAALLFTIGASISLADSPPPLPNTFSGTVKFTNSGGQFDAPAGTLIEALINNVTKSSAIVITAGRYSIDVIGTNEDGGKDINFRVGGTIAGQKAVFNVSSPPPQTLDLTAAGTLPTPPGGGDGDSGDGGSSGGGGGSFSGEDFLNIEIKEKYELYIFKDKATSYAFTNKSNPILFINITGNVNAGAINTMVEVLRNTSSLVKSPAQGKVYKNINLWVGSSGFAVPKNIKEAVIRFRVEGSWLDDNNLGGSDIRMTRWDGSRWVELETTEVTKDNKYTYFEAKTDAFSPFAITGLKGTVTPITTTPIESTPAVTGTPATTPGGAPPVNLVLILVVLVLIAIIAVLYRLKK